jgi:lysozyme family protein
MQHPFDALSAEYTALLAQMQVTRQTEVNATATRLLTCLPHYAQASAQTGVPACWLAAVGEREGGAEIFRTYFGNGDPLNRPTRDVPRGRGPFASFEAGLLDALHYDHIDQGNPQPWTWPWACWRGEAWNGFGPRAHGRHTGYLWAGTSIYRGGKYVSDGKWDPNAQDEQLGIVPVMMHMMALDASLSLDGQPSPQSSPVVAAPPVPTPEGLHDAAALQTVLNYMGADPPLTVDNSYGRQTTAAVRAFQTANGLAADGIAGPATWAAINAKLSA